MATFYDLSAKNIDGEEVSFEKYKGKVCLVINVASRCGYTDQYGPMQKLHEERADQDFELLGFPCNQFAEEEPGTDAEVKEFCTTEYGVTFDMYSKIDVKYKNKSPVYDFLTSEDGPWDEHEVRWNFQKYIIGKDGKVRDIFDPKIEPDSQKIAAAIDSALQG